MVRYTGDPWINLAKTVLKGYTQEDKEACPILYELWEAMANFDKTDGSSLEDGMFSGLIC